MNSFDAQMQRSVKAHSNIHFAIVALGFHILCSEAEADKGEPTVESCNYGDNEFARNGPQLTMANPFAERANEAGVWTQGRGGCGRLEQPSQQQDEIHPTIIAPKSA